MNKDLFSNGRRIVIVNVRKGIIVIFVTLTFKKFWKYINIMAFCVEIEGKGFVLFGMIYKSYVQITNRDRDIDYIVFD